MKKLLIAAAILAVATPAWANGTTFDHQVNPAWCENPDGGYPNDNFAIGRPYRWGPCWAWAK